MRSFMFMILFFSGMHTLQAQSVMNLKNNNAINFAYNSPADLLQQKNIENALELELGLLGPPTYVSAQITFDEGHSITQQYANKIILRQTHTTSPSVSGNIIDVLLTMAPVQLFTQPATGGAHHTYTFYYDLVLLPITTFVTPGSHSFSITFTCTKP